MKGRVVFEVEGGSSTTAKAGETVFISKGTRFRPSFPVGDTQCVPSPNFTTHNAFHYSIHFFKFRYVPVCVPAFRPDRCIREDTYGSTVLFLRLELISAISVDAAVLGRARAVERLRSKTGIISSEAEAVMQYAIYP